MFAEIVLQVRATPARRKARASKKRNIKTFSTFHHPDGVVDAVAQMFVRKHRDAPPGLREHARDLLEKVALRIEAATQFIFWIVTMFALRCAEQRTLSES